MQLSQAGGNIKLQESSWYKDAVIYELHVRSFFDSNGDGVGDFPGLIQKLDYLVNLGVTAVWLLPFYPSPLKDGGYDISDYRSIDPAYGTMRDWRNFLREAHARGLKVITELVVNHTSDQHAWFQRSRRAAPGSRSRDFSVWTNDSQKYKHARIIFKDFEVSNWTWDPVAGAYFWHRFYSHQPDLNFDNPEVHKAIFRVLDFWLEQGVDGFRLDAVPYLYERENTSCENLPETHEFLKELRRHVDSRFSDKLLLAEANQWPDDAVSYFGQGDGDECHMAFHFPLMPRLFMGVRMEDRVPIVDILEQTPSLPSVGQWALFLRNHDELTLEMVTDEERDYMYRVYAQDTKARLNLGIRRRLAPLLGNDRKKIELLNMLLLSMPGTPVLYYGDEIGMGDNIYLGDRFGIRTPMHWSSDKNAGFSRANPQALPLPVVVSPEYHYEAINVETQETNSNSLLWWTRRLLNLRTRWKAFGRGTLEFIHADNRKILAFVRRHDNECVLVVANLSRLPQPVELNLTAFTGSRPIELFGRTEFPVVTSAPYIMTLAPHSAFWFLLQTAADREGVAQGFELRVQADWKEIFTAALFPELTRAIRPFLEKQSWYAGRGNRIENIRLEDLLEVPGGCLALLLIEYFQHDSEHYLIPLAYAAGIKAKDIHDSHPGLIIANLSRAGESGVLYDGLGSEEFVEQLLVAIAKRRPIKGQKGTCRPWQAGTETLTPDKSGSSKRLLADRLNNSLVLQDGFFYKLIRKLEPGTNPEIEIEQHLREKRFLNVPPLVGTIDYESKFGGAMSCLVLSRVVPESTNTLIFLQSALDRYFDRVQTRLFEDHPTLRVSRSVMDWVGMDVPPAVPEVVGTFPEIARLLGQRTAQLHLALADSTQQDFAPEPFTPFYLRSLYQSIRNRIRDSLDLLRSRIDTFPPEFRAAASKVIERKSEVFSRIQELYKANPHGVRIRCHGNYDLGKTLYTGKDFYVIDLEGDASRPISERRIKRPPVYDLVKMIISFRFAARHKLEDRIASANLTREKALQLYTWAGVWAYWVSISFFKGYFSAIGPDSVLAQSLADRKLLFHSLIIDRVAREIIDSIEHAPGRTEGLIEAWLRTLDYWTI